MTQLLVIGESTTRIADEQFLDLICQDAELLAAEFEAIVAAEWAEPPVGGPGPDAAGCHPGSAAARVAAERGRGPVALPRHPGIRGWAQQRAPPLPTRLTQPRSGRQVIATGETRTR